MVSPRAQVSRARAARRVRHGGADGRSRREVDRSSPRRLVAHSPLPAKRCRRFRESPESVQASQAPAPACCLENPLRPLDELNWPFRWERELGGLSSPHPLNFCACDARIEPVPPRRPPHRGRTGFSPSPVCASSASTAICAAGPPESRPARARIIRHRRVRRFSTLHLASRGPIADVRLSVSAPLLPRRSLQS